MPSKKLSLKDLKAPKRLYPNTMLVKQGQPCAAIVRPAGVGLAYRHRSTLSPGRRRPWESMTSYSPRTRPSTSNGISRLGRLRCVLMGPPRSP